MLHRYRGAADLDADGKVTVDDLYGYVARWLWVVAVVLVVLWILLFFLAHIGGLSHLLLLIALIVMVYNLIRNRRAV